MAAVSAEAVEGTEKHKSLQGKLFPLLEYQNIVLQVTRQDAGTRLF